MNVLNFKKIEISDMERFQELLRWSNFRGCDYTFGNSFVWSDIYDIELYMTEEFLFRKTGKGENTRFVFPAGSGEVSQAVENLSGYCKELGIPFQVTANKQIADKIAEIYPNAEIKLNRDISDYIYLAEDLEELKGKKYHAKRNHLNRFYENDWSFEPLNSGNILECREMNRLWREENIDECKICAKDPDTASKLDELCIVEKSFANYDKLGYTGGVIRVNGEVQAFTFGEPSSDDCFVVHVEKALRQFQGAYAAINREFVRSLGGRYKYINREDDAGSENLRKAKLSYYPVFMEEKFDIQF